MSSRRRETVLWGLLVLVFAALAVWNLWQVWRYRGEVERLQRELGGARAAEAEQAATLGDAHALTLAFAGRRLAWPDDLEQVSGRRDAASHVAGHRLLMYFSEASCNTCRESETQFMNGLSGATGGAGVAVIAHASNPRYVQNFVRLNGLAEMPVFYDRNGAFGSVNGIGETPMLFVLDAEGRVVAALFPLPGRPQWSEPFHRRAEVLLGLR